MQTFGRELSLVDVPHVRAVVEKQGFRLANEEIRVLPTGKTLWLGIFSNAAMSPE
jgi:hypothetical protein